MSGLVNILGSTSTTAGLTAAVWASVAAISTRAASKQQTKRLDEASERMALQSTDIQILGGYLYENLGNARIGSYVRDEELRDRVTRTLDVITSFLGPEPPQPEPEAPVSPVIPLELASPAVRDEMEKALRDIRFGEVWNGLARTRRIIEIRLRELSSQIPEDRPIAISRMLASLTKEGFIPAEAANFLRYAISVSNAGIHGEEVDAGQAEEAWRSALQGLAILEGLQS